MKMIHQLFLEALKTSLKNENITWSFEVSKSHWHQLFKIACEQHVLPMIYTAVCNCPAIRTIEPEILTFYRSETMKSVTAQAIKTEEFFRILRYLDDSGLHPLTVKGLICRSLYPHPDYRDSGDEDLLVPPDEFEACQKALCNLGLQSIRKGFSEDTWDIAYGRQGHPIYIELHPLPFPPDAGTYGDWNAFFRNVHRHTMKININGQKVMTMNANDHLFYLICHALKHFFHSGFGIRQVCDILLFASHYGSAVHWQQLYARCQAINAVSFTAAIFKIGIKYLGFDFEMIHPPNSLHQLFMHVDEAPLLEDLLTAGLYGSASVSRKHSSLMTLYVMQQKNPQLTWKTLPLGWVPAIFPPLHEMVRQDPKLHAKPWLLPAAWYRRWRHYFSGQKLYRQVHEGLYAVKTGVYRIRLMHYYHLIPEKHMKKGGLSDAARHQIHEKNTERYFLGDFK